MEIRQLALPALRVAYSREELRFGAGSSIPQCHACWRAGSAGFNSMRERETVQGCG